MPINFAKPRLIVLGDLSISDHNRDGLDINVERIETAKRMANGTMRKYVVADKRTFSTSWTMLPNLSRYTVDGFAGADALEQFYNSHEDAFPLRLYYGDGETTIYTVMFEDFSKTLSKRGRAFDLYSVNISLVEV